MKLYLINNICVSTAPISGTVEVEIPTIVGDNPSNYLNKRITVFDGGYKVEVPSPEELNPALTIYNALKESASKDVYLLEVEQRLTTLELKGMI